MSVTYSMLSEIIEERVVHYLCLKQHHPQTLEQPITPYGGMEMLFIQLIDEMENSLALTHPNLWVRTAKQYLLWKRR